MKTVLLLICPILVFGTGCSIMPTHMTETQRQAIYESVDAAKAGRYDLVDDANSQIQRIIPPPKKRIPVIPIDK